MYCNHVMTYETRPGGRPRVYILGGWSSGCNCLDHTQGFECGLFLYEYVGPKLYYFVFSLSILAKTENNDVLR